MMDSVKLNANAKINLTLNITGTLENGYHTIESFICPVSLADGITITKTDNEKIVITCDKPHIPLGQTNLCYKAAERFFTEYGIVNDGLQIDIHKVIPDQAGLGGGSADAAVVLRGLCSMYGVKEDERLFEIGFSVGADVPFCIKNKPSFVTGMGENLVETSPIPDCYIVIVKPDFGSSTQIAYSKYDSMEKYVRHDSNRMKDAISKSDLDLICGNLWNIFEELLDIDEIFSIKNRLKKFGAIGSSMSGSGTAVFGIFSNEKMAENAVRNFRSNYPSTFLSTPL